jgi:hypothetical protein
MELSPRPLQIPTAYFNYNSWGLVHSERLVEVYNFKNVLALFILVRRI